MHFVDQRQHAALVLFPDRRGGADGREGAWGHHAASLGSSSASVDRSPEGSGLGESSDFHPELRDPFKGNHG